MWGWRVSRLGFPCVWPWRSRVAEAHHARRSREASIEAPPRLHLRIHRFGFKRRHRADDPGGRPPMARAPRGEGPEVRLPGPGGVEVGHRVRVAALREVLVREQERHQEAGARSASGRAGLSGLRLASAPDRVLHREQLRALVEDEAHGAVPAPDVRSSSERKNRAQNRARARFFVKIDRAQKQKSSSNLGKSTCR